MLKNFSHPLKVKYKRKLEGSTVNQPSCGTSSQHGEKPNLSTDLEKSASFGHWKRRRYRHTKRESHCRKTIRAASVAGGERKRAPKGRNAESQIYRNLGQFAGEEFQSARKNTRKRHAFIERAKRSKRSEGHSSML